MPLPSNFEKLAGQALAFAVGTAAGAAASPVLEPALRELSIEVNRIFPNVPLDPAQLALLRQRGHIDAARQHDESQDSGLDAERAELLFQGSGISYGIGEALELLRRRAIDEARFREVVAKGDVRVEFTPDLLQLAQVKLSPALAAEAIIRERTTRERALRIAADAGISEEDFDLMADVGGRPIATVEALDVIGRRAAGRPLSPDELAFFRQVVARSDVRTEYTSDLLELYERLPSLFQVRQAVKSGSVPDALAVETLLKERYSRAWAEAMVAQGHVAKTQRHRELAESQVLELYETGLETQEWARTQLQGLGFDPPEADFVLLLVEARRLLAFLRAAINRTHASFVNHKIDDEQAVNDLDALEIAPEARNRFLTLWKVERETNVRRLTEAQVATALRRGLETPEGALARLRAMGYPLGDATILVELVTGRPLPPAAA